MPPVWAKTVLTWVLEGGVAGDGLGVVSGHLGRHFLRRLRSRSHRGHHPLLGLHLRRSDRVRLLLVLLLRTG